MTIRVLYGRHMGRYWEEFKTLDEAWSWISAQEDHGEIYAAEIWDDQQQIYDGSDPFAKPRWQPIQT